MENFLDFFETMPSWQKLGWIFICLSFSWIIEAVAPLFKLPYNKWKHTGVNMLFLASDLSINLLFGLATVGVFTLMNIHGIGLLNWIELPTWLGLVISILMLDFVAQYLVHYFLHKVKWMWKLHMVHHSDTKVDATTGTRHHLGDYLLREVASLITIIIFGIPLAYYILYRIITILFTYITHANFYLPIWIDKPLSTIFITPNTHKFHHHFERPWTDTNFGNVFSIWDRLFGTFVYDDPKKIIYGLDVLDGKKDEDVIYQLKVPFDNSIETDY